MELKRLSGEGESTHDCVLTRPVNPWSRASTILLKLLADNLKTNENIKYSFPTPEQ